MSIAQCPGIVPIASNRYMVYTPLAARRYMYDGTNISRNYQVRESLAAAAAAAAAASEVAWLQIIPFREVEQKDRSFHVLGTTVNGDEVHGRFY